MEVRCRCCHRVERHGPSGVTIELPGGSRRAPEPVHVAAFEALRAITSRGGVLVDACPACGQPRDTDDAAARERAGTWSFPLPDGPPLAFTRAGAFERGGATVAAPEAERLVREAWPPPPPESAPVRVAQGTMLALMVGPVLFWVMLFGFWLNFVANLGGAPWLAK